ncbi:MAG TPA: chemotaxis-specific protein-glutamate methyltransferase CheB [Acidimicrobiia bacterium]|jgi:two-component system chemotaxis response regulator CheB|nr:chemotaxis-specific protein-glutamate methyltransferase CheB [Acidimicrobiia bacterium]
MQAGKQMIHENEKILRVLVAEDSATVRAHVRSVLDADPGLTVVGEAADGQGAIARCLELRPDVITMDMMMPEVSGLAATEYLMAHRPTPILIVSSSIDRGELFHTYDALAAGAVDVLEKPDRDTDPVEWSRRLVSSVKRVARIRVITHPRARLLGHSMPVAPPPPGIARSTRPAVVTIGASTGGPGAIVEVLRGLPASFDLPTLFVLHIGAPFGTAFVEWLDGQLDRPVVEARAGMEVSALAGSVAMARPERHLGVRDGCLYLSDAPERHSCRPSIDVLFETVAQEYGPRAVGCLLTGMGRDGAAGLRLMRDSGGITIAQDEATSVVYGMPREAVRLDAVEHVLPLGAIGPALASLVDARNREHAR